LSVEITRAEISMEVLTESVRTDNTGGIVSFIGTVRAESKGKKIEKLDYEVYEEMALKELEALEKRALEEFELENIIIVHRIGTFKVSERVVAILVAARHRKDAFSACQFIIDELKQSVPIWKKEYAVDGEYWVEGPDRQK
jgi:molybdopterin synthase catalytic subunit